MRSLRLVRVAVVIPCFNDGRVVGEAVDSVRASAEPTELVVVDDGSSDPHTAEVLDRLRADGVNVLRQDNAGLPRARMAGVANTTAPYVFPLDADDLAEPDALGPLADALDADPGAAVAYGDYVEFGGPREVVRAAPGWLDPYRLAYANEFPVSALFRREALERTGGWREGPYGFEDWDLWMHLAERGERGVHLGPGRVTYRRRLHGERMLTESKRRYPELYRNLREHRRELFAHLPEHRRRSDLSPVRKALYPIVYGGRRRYAWEPRVKALLDRVGVWTMRR